MLVSWSSVVFFFFLGGGRVTPDVLSQASDVNDDFPFPQGHGFDEDHLKM